MVLAGPSFWYPILGWFLFWIGLLTALIMYLSKKRWYPIAYLISILLYIFTLGFVIDVFNLSKNTILLLLALSALIMMSIGGYLSKKFAN